MRHNDNQHLLTDCWYMIVNPAAAEGRALEDFPQVAKILRDEGVLFEPHFTEHKSHAVELTVAAVQSGYRKIIVYGGDGTLHEVVNGLFIQQLVPTQSVPVAVIAVGEGRNWARNFGAAATYLDAVQAIARGECYLQDVGVVSYEQAHYRQQRYMSIVAGVGFDALVTGRYAHLRNKGRRHPLFYTWSLVKSFFRYKSTGVKVWVDGKLLYNNLLMSIAIGIGRYNGVGMQQLPEAVADDGLLDMSLVRPVHFWHILFRLRYLFDGGLYRIGHISKARGSKIRIESTPEIMVEVDGELLGGTPLEFEVLHRAICVVGRRE